MPVAIVDECLTSELFAEVSPSIFSGLLSANETAVTHRVFSCVNHFRNSSSIGRGAPES